MIFIYLACAAVVSFIVHLSMHEIGHLIGGRATGWRFIYIQVFYFAIVKNGSRIRFKFIPVFNNQCIMYPKSTDTEAGVYTMSGCYMNLMLAIGGFVLLLFGGENIRMWIYSWCFFCIGTAFVLMNAIPNTRKVCNDMACNILLKTEYITRLCHNSQLIIAKYLSDGYTYKRIDRELIFLTEDRAVNDILAYQTVIEYYYHLESDEYEKMKAALGKIDLDAHISKEISDIVLMEQLYTDLVEGIKSKRSLSSSYPDDIDEYISKHEAKRDVHSLRVKAAYHAYEYIMGEDNEKAREYIISALAGLGANNCQQEVNCKKVVYCQKPICHKPIYWFYEGERIFCLKQLERILKLCQEA